MACSVVYFTFLQTRSVIEGGSHSAEHERWSMTELSMICVLAGEWEKLDFPAYVLMRVCWHKLQKVKTVVLKLVPTGGQNSVQ